MPACRPRESKPAAGIRPSVVSPCWLVELAAERLVLSVDVAAAKFASGQRINDPVREQEILDWVADRLAGTGPRHAVGVAFFRDQIAASKVVQHGLHARWRDHPPDIPPRWRDLTAEIRPELDVINKDMLSVLANVEAKLPSHGHCNSLFDSVLQASPALERLGALRHATARIALRSLRHADDALRWRLLSAFAVTSAIPLRTAAGQKVPSPSTLTVSKWLL